MCTICGAVCATAKRGNSLRIQIVWNKSGEASAGQGFVSAEAAGREDYRVLISVLLLPPRGALQSRKQLRLLDARDH